MFVLSLSNTNRVLCASVLLTNGNYDGMPIVDTLPEGNLPDYLYIDGEYIYDPLPMPDPVVPVIEPTVWDELDAAYQKGYDEGYTKGVNSAYDQ